MFHACAFQLDERQLVPDLPRPPQHIVFLLFLHLRQRTSSSLPPPRAHPLEHPLEHHLRSAARKWRARECTHLGARTPLVDDPALGPSPLILASVALPRAPPRCPSVALGTTGCARRWGSKEYHRGKHSCIVCWCECAGGGIDGRSCGALIHGCEYEFECGF